ncbi:MAG TPA: cytochrome c biogenesis protein CcsA [Bacteroidota bacterium]|nr:cytochrome c biogenesis protein CcsA [Bacteroidota bacterium]
MDESHIVMAVEFFSAALPVLYGILVVIYGLSFFKPASRTSSVRSPFLIGVLLLHLVYLALRVLAYDHPPITNVFEVMTLMAAAITTAYMYIEWRTATSSTGVFILLLAFAFQTVSSIFIRSTVKIPDYLHSLVLGFHVSSALLGYTAISLSAVYGLLYLLLYHEIKSTRFGVIYNRLPNLETLEIMSHKAEVFGFASLTVAISIGLLWLPRVFKDFSYFDPKLVGTIGIWILYAVGLGARRTFGLQGRKMMVLSLIAFGCVFLSMTVINLFLSGFHSFH